MCGIKNAQTQDSPLSYLHQLTWVVSPILSDVLSLFPSVVAAFLLFLLHLPDISLLTPHFIAVQASSSSPPASRPRLWLRRRRRMAGEEEREGEGYPQPC